MNLNQVTLAVTDMAESNNFYRTLGFTQIVESPHYARFECPIGDASFSLALAESANPGGTTIYFEQEKLDEWVGELKEKGIYFDSEPTDQSYLWREATLRDPSGNAIKLYWAGENRLNPPWRIEKSAL